MCYSKLWKPTFIVGIVIGFCCLFYRAQSITDLPLPPCPFHLLTGMHCPGCGSTRALHKLAHGEFLAAIRFNPLTVCAIPVVLFLVVRKDRNTFPVIPGWILIGIIVTFGILRNVPAYPFILFRP